MVRLQPVNGTTPRDRDALILLWKPSVIEVGESSDILLEHNSISITNGLPSACSCRIKIQHGLHHNRPRARSRNREYFRSAHHRRNPLQSFRRYELQRRRWQLLRSRRDLLLPPSSSNRDHVWPSRMFYGGLL